MNEKLKTKNSKNEIKENKLLLSEDEKKNEKFLSEKFAFSLLNAIISIDNARKFFLSIEKKKTRKCFCIEKKYAQLLIITLTSGCPICCFNQIVSSRSSLLRNSNADN